MIRRPVEYLRVKFDIPRSPHAKSAVVSVFLAAFDKTVASIVQVLGATTAVPGVSKSQYACRATNGTTLCPAAVTLKDGTPELTTGSDGSSVASSEKTTFGATKVAADSL